VYIYIPARVFFLSSFFTDVASFSLRSSLVFFLTGELSLSSASSGVFPEGKQNFT
jgi:hypothetical protein